MRLFHSFINATQFYHNDYYSFCASTKKRFIVCIDILMPVLGNLVIICLTFMCVFSLHRKDMIFVILLRVLQDAHNLVCGYNLDVKKIKAPSLLNLLSHARIEQFLDECRVRLHACLYGEQTNLGGYIIILAWQRTAVEEKMYACL